MLKLKLQRVGKKKQAYFRLIATEHTRRPKGRYLELLGFFDPHANKTKLKEDRIKYWLSKGLKPTDTVYNLLVSKGILGGPKKEIKKQKKKKGRAETKPQELVKVTDSGLADKQKKTEDSNQGVADKSEAENKESQQKEEQKIES